MKLNRFPFSLARENADHDREQARAIERAEARAEERWVRESLAKDFHCEVCNDGRWMSPGCFCMDCGRGLVKPEKYYDKRAKRDLFREGVERVNAMAAQNSLLLRL